MLFSSYQFLFIFFPLTLAGYFLIGRAFNHSVAKLFLVFASLIFYAQWNSAYLLLIGVSIVVNFKVGDWLLHSITSQSTSQSPAQQSAAMSVVPRKLIFVAGIVFNLALLGYFKYFDFFILNLNAVFGTDFSILNIILPLAISFFTFQQIAFLTERYLGSTERYSFLDYSLFVVFFPQLIAGPIVQPKDTLQQFHDPKSIQPSSRNMLLGLVLFSIGIFKKVVVADSFVAVVAGGFDVSSAVLSTFEAWMVALSYTFQLYFDFSGYTDMALGLGLMFNIRLPLNFNSPYKATSIQDFWRRWHITLSNFLRDHIYIPMGGNRVALPQIYFNLFITFLLGGLWHGAGWTFVIWGAMHGAGLCVHRLWSSMGLKMPATLGWFITMVFVITAWVFFRATDFTSGMNIITAMYSPSGWLTEFAAAFGGIESAFLTDLDISAAVLAVKLGLCMLVCVGTVNATHMIFSANANEITFKIWQLFGYALMMVLGVLTISLQEYTEFIYFNF